MVFRLASSAPGFKSSGARVTYTRGTETSLKAKFGSCLLGNALMIRAQRSNGFSVGFAR